MTDHEPRRCPYCRRGLFHDENICNICAQPDTDEEIRA
jgi:RNA polymerase subunit RPABC4/transcription elongation factor Spt4